MAHLLKLVKDSITVIVIDDFFTIGFVIPVFFVVLKVLIVFAFLNCDLSYRSSSFLGLTEFGVKLIGILSFLSAEVPKYFSVISNAALACSPAESRVTFEPCTGHQTRHDLWAFRAAYLLRLLMTLIDIEP